MLQIARNITTNEMANMLRYSYLRGPDGRFRNPFDQGCKKNCTDFLINGYNEDIECIEESREPEGIGMISMTRSANLTNGASHAHQTNVDGHVIIDVSSNSHQGHIHSSQCSQSQSQSQIQSQSHSQNHANSHIPLGLGVGLGRNVSRSAVVS